jgi:hypothetical protein
VSNNPLPNFRFRQYIDTYRAQFPQLSTRRFVFTKRDNPFLIEHYSLPILLLGNPMGLVAEMLGALVPTYLFAALFVWLLKRFLSGSALAIVANALSLGAAFVLAAYGHDDGSGPRWSAGYLYVLPQIVWLDGGGKSDPTERPFSRPAVGELRRPAALLADWSPNNTKGCASWTFSTDKK